MATIDQQFAAPRHLLATGQVDERKNGTPARW
jgi:hypothetical protein